MRIGLVSVTLGCNSREMGLKRYVQIIWVQCQASASEPYSTLVTSYNCISALNRLLAITTVSKRRVFNIDWIRSNFIAISQVSSSRYIVSLCGFITRSSDFQTPDEAPN